MARSTNPAKRRQWIERFQRYSESGLTVTAFCRAESVSVPSFYLWRKKIAAAGDDAHQFSRRRRPAFVPVQIASATQIEIHFPNGARVHLPASDAALISSVIAAVGHVPVFASRETDAC